MTICQRIHIMVKRLQRNPALRAARRRQSGIYFAHRNPLYCVSSQVHLADFVHCICRNHAIRHSHSDRHQEVTVRQHLHTVQVVLSDATRIRIRPERVPRQVRYHHSARRSGQRIQQLHSTLRSHSRNRRRLHIHLHICRHRACRKRVVHIVRRRAIRERHHSPHVIRRRSPHPSHKHTHLARSVCRTRPCLPSIARVRSELHRHAP